MRTLAIVSSGLLKLLAAGEETALRTGEVTRISPFVRLQLVFDEPEPVGEVFLPGNDAVFTPRLPLAQQVYTCLQLGNLILQLIDGALRCVVLLG